MNIPKVEQPIVVNGVELTEAQGLALRMGLARLILDLEDPDMLGKDQTSRDMVRVYRQVALETQDILLRSAG